MTTLSTDGAVTIPLLVHSDGSEGENQFKVTAQAAGGETYTFTVNVPYKLRGDGIVKIETSLDEETKVLNGTKITMTMQAWSEKKDDGTLIARMTASDTVVTLDGETLRCDGTVGGRLQYTMIPENPETGDENELILRIVCEDAYGNRGEKTLTLRGERMYEFTDKLVSIALPRVRDFHGVSAKAFDGRGNYALGVREQLIFPEIEYDKVEKIRGMEMIFVTTAKTDEEAKELLRLLGMPFAQA